MASLADQMNSLISGAHEIRPMVNLKSREDLSRLFKSHLRLYFDFYAYKGEVVAVRDHADRFDRCSKHDYVVNLVLLLVKGIVRALLIESIGEPEEKAQFLRKTIKDIADADPDFASPDVPLAQQVLLFEKKAMLSGSFRAGFVEYLNRVICTKFRGMFKTADRFLESQWRDASLVESALSIIKHVVLHQGIRSNICFATQDSKKTILNYFEIFQILPDIIVVLSIDDNRIWISNAIFDNGTNRNLEIEAWAARDSFPNKLSDNKLVRDPWNKPGPARTKPFEFASEKQVVSVKKSKPGLSPGLNLERFYKKPSESSNDKISLYPRSSGETGTNRFGPSKTSSESDQYELNLYEERSGNPQVSSRPEGHSRQTSMKSLNQSGPFNQENQLSQSDFDRQTRTQPLKDPFLHSRSSSRNTVPKPVSSSSGTSVRLNGIHPDPEYHQFLLARREARADPRLPVGVQPAGPLLKQSNTQPKYKDEPKPGQFDNRTGQLEYHSVSSGSQGFLDNIIGGMNRGTGESSDREKQLSFRGSGSSNPFPNYPSTPQQEEGPMLMLRELSKQPQKPVFVQAAQETPRNLYQPQQTFGSYTDRYLTNLDAKKPSFRSPQTGDQRQGLQTASEGRIFGNLEPSAQARDGSAQRRPDALVGQSNGTLKANPQLAAKPASQHQPYFAEQRFTFAPPAQPVSSPHLFARRETGPQMGQIPAMRSGSPLRPPVPQNPNPSSKINIFGQSQDPQPQQAYPFAGAPHFPYFSTPATATGTAPHLYQPSYQNQLKPLIEPNSVLDFSLGSIVNAFDRNTDLIAERRRTDRGDSVGRREPAVGGHFSPINIYAPSLPQQRQHSDRLYQ